MKDTHIAALASALTLTVSHIFSPVAATQPGQNREAQLASMMRVRMSPMVVNSQICPQGECVEISTTLHPEQDPTDTYVNRYSSNDQYNAECIECFAVSTKPAPPVKKDETCKLIFGRNEPGGEIGTSVYRPGPVLQYFKKHPDQDPGAVVLIHKIPYCKETLKQANFTDADLNNEENLIAIPLKNTQDLKKSGKRKIEPAYVAEILRRGEKWKKLFTESVRSNKAVPKEEIIRFAKELDNAS